MSEQKKLRSGGIESLLEGVGLFYLVISIISFFICVFFSQDEVIKETSSSSFWIVLGIGVLAQGIIFWILFKAGSEIIRLLKKLNGLPYGGIISKTVGGGVEYSCTKCGASVSPNSNFCTQCGANFDDEEEEETEPN